MLIGRGFVEVFDHITRMGIHRPNKALPKYRYFVPVREPKNALEN